MNRCSHGVWMGRSNSGTSGPNDFTGLRWTRQSGAAATPCCKLNSRSNLPSCVHSFGRRYWSGELRHICKDGHEVIVDSRMQLLGDDTVLEVNRNIMEAKALINERKQFEHALR